MPTFIQLKIFITGFYLFDLVNKKDYFSKNIFKKKCDQFFFFFKFQINKCLAYKMLDYYFFSVAFVVKRTEKLLSNRANF